MKILSIIDIIKKRKSVRRFTDQEVSEEDLKAVLEAARLAPSGTNAQPWHFIIIKNKDTQKELANLIPWGSFIKNAPIIIAILVNTKATWAILDGAIAMTHITLEAAARGLGTCWVANWPNVPKKPELETQIKNILGIPEELQPKMKVITITPLGHPHPRGSMTTKRKPLEDIVHFEKF